MKFVMMSLDNLDYGPDCNSLYYINGDVNKDRQFSIVDARFVMPTGKVGLVEESGILKTLEGIVGSFIRGEDDAAFIGQLLSDRKDIVVVCTNANNIKTASGTRNAKYTAIVEGKNIHDSMTDEDIWKTATNLTMDAMSDIYKVDIRRNALNSIEDELVEDLSTMLGIPKVKVIEIIGKVVNDPGNKNGASGLNLGDILDAANGCTDKVPEVKSPADLGEDFDLTDVCREVFDSYKKPKFLN